MKRTTHSPQYARIAAIAFLAMAGATFLIAATGVLRTVFFAQLPAWLMALGGVALLIPGVGLLMRKTWAWYAGLLVSAGFTAAGLTQVVAQQHIGLLTVPLGVGLFYAVVRASSYYKDAVYPIIPEGTVDTGDHRVIGGTYV